MYLVVSVRPSAMDNYPYVSSKEYNYQSIDFTGSEITEFPSVRDTQKYCRTPNFFTRVSDRTPCQNQGKAFRMFLARLS